MRRVIIPGVQIVEERAFGYCKALTDVECDKLRIIKENAFESCEFLGRINLPAAEIVKEGAFESCTALTQAKFGPSSLLRFDSGLFCGCTSLERITLPLKNGIFTDDDIFQACGNLVHVDLVERAELHEIIAALHLEEWRNDIKEEIDSINQNLPNALAGRLYEYGDEEEEYGGKTQAIRTWISSVLCKIIHYQQEHQHILDKAATTLQYTFPQDIVMNNVLPFLELPSLMFEVGNEGDAEDADENISMSWGEYEEEVNDGGDYYSM